MNTDFKNKIDNKINILRLLSIEMVQHANSGHPGMPLGCAPMMYVLWFIIMKYNPKNPNWINRDRFILSNGHGCSLLYSTLHLAGFNITLNDLKNFRKINSITPGHPEIGITPGVEITTGPLGQGIANGVGMAIASKKLASRFNKDDLNLISHKIYVMCGDGCLMEGISSEAASLAGHLKLNNLIVLYDDNNISIDGNTDLTFTEDVTLRFKSFGWEVLQVIDGNNDYYSIENSIYQAQKSDKPVLIKVKTKIGYLSNKENSEKSHGSPLGEDEVKRLRQKFNFDNYNHFEFPNELLEEFKNMINIGNQHQNDWKNNLELYKKKYNDDYNEFMKYQNNTYNTDFLPKFDKDFGKKATRDMSSKCIKVINDNIQNLIVGSADLSPSNKTITTTNIYNSSNYNGSYIHYGVREHAMAAISNGISTYNIVTIASTFLMFINYCLASIRLSALSKHRVIYVFTHDSVALGEDGPTHQPIESLLILRGIPDLLTFRPADGNEVSAAYEISLNHNGPSCICLARQGTNQLDNLDKYELIKKGAYNLYQNGTDEDLKLIVLSTGSETCTVMECIKKYDLKNIRIVSMPCLELYELQNDIYKEKLLPKNICKISFEAGSTLSWYKYANHCFGIDEFGKSGDGDKVLDYFGLSVDKIYNKILNFY